METKVYVIDYRRKSYTTGKVYGGQKNRLDPNDYTRRRTVFFSLPNAQAKVDQLNAQFAEQDGTYVIFETVRNVPDDLVRKAQELGFLDSREYNRRKGGETMPKGKPASQAMLNAIEKYQKEKTTTVLIRLNFSTDADIIEALEHCQPSKMGYIKRLIREDLERQKKNPG